MAKKKPIKKTKPEIVGRDTKCASLTGITGCGKSYESIIIAKKIAANKRVLVITYTGSGKTWDMCKKISPTKEALSFKTGWRKIHYVEHDEEAPLEAVALNCKNLVVILDDCREYMKSSWARTPGLKSLMIAHRHQGMDLLFVAHTPLQIPKQCWGFIEYSWVFKCSMLLKKSEMPMANFLPFMEVQERVNKKYLEAREKTEGKRKPRGVFEVIRH